MLVSGWDENRTRLKNPTEHDAYCYQSHKGIPHSKICRHVTPPGVVQGVQVGRPVTCSER